MQKQPPQIRQKAEAAGAALPALMVAAERAAFSVLQGEHARRKSGPGEKFWQFREYHTYDRPQDIDWRQSGKTDRVFIRQKERQTPQTVLLWCCSAESMDFSSRPSLPTKAEHAKIITLALALLMTRAGERVGLLGEMQTGRTEHTLEKIGALLCMENDNSPLPAAGLSRQQTGSTIILAGDFLTPPEETQDIFRNLSLQAGGGLLLQILDPAEIELPYDGRAVFEDWNNTRELVQNVPSIRDAYRQRIENHLQLIQNLAAGNGWNYILHRTDAALEDTLMNIWQSLDISHRRRPA